MTLPANIRINLAAPFPAQVTGGNIIVVTKANGIYTVKADFADLAQITDQALGSDTVIVAVYDETAGSFFQVPLAGLLRSPTRIITAAGTVPGLPGDGAVIFKKNDSAPSTYNLVAAAQAARDVTIKDLTGDALNNNITIAASGLETIDGLSSMKIDANYGVVTLGPVPGTGWYIKSISQF